MKKDLVILIPAYYEGPRIEKVLNIVTAYERAKRIVVIDDGSPDNTSKKAGNFPVEVLTHDKNYGKGMALQTGINHVKKKEHIPFWIFVDADLINLNKEHLDKLIEPLEKDPAKEMSVGILTRGGKLRVDLAQKYFGILNGQRGFSSSFINSLPDLSWCRFGVEIFLSKTAKAAGVPVAYPVLEGLTHHTKEDKFGYTKGAIYRMQMYRECLKALFTWKKHLPTSIYKSTDSEKKCQS